MNPASLAPSRLLGILQRRLMPMVGILLVLVLIGVLLAARAAEPVQVIDRIERCLEITDASRYASEELISLLARPYREPAAQCWQSVALPDISRSMPVMDMSKPQNVWRVWFRIRDLPTTQLPDNTALWIYVPRVVGGTWQAWLNGQPLADNRSNWRLTWNEPVHLQIPPALLKSNVAPDLRIAISFHPELGYTFSRAYGGSPTALDARIAMRAFLQETVPRASNFVLLTMGVLFFIFWLARRQETTHLLLPLAGIAWAVCNLQYVLPRPDSDLLHEWYDAIVTLSITWVMWLIYLFALRFDAMRGRALEYFLPAFVLFMTLIQLPIWPFALEFDILFQLGNLAIGLTVTGFIMWRAWKSGRVELKVIGVSLALAIGGACHDIALYAQVVDPEHIYLLPFSTVVVYGALLFALLCRYVSAINTAEAYNAQLKQRLQEQKAELATQYRRLRDTENQRVLLSERQRLMLDMHDGLGSALLSTLVAVERGNLPQGEVVAVLRDCIEDLRLVIDSLEPLGHDLELLLATLRHRLGQRLQAAGLTLDWHVEDLPKLLWMESPQALQVMRIVQEVLTNIVKHAHASRVRIVAHHEPADGQVVITLEDDGDGFSEEGAVPGRGHKHLRSRSQALGIGLLIHSVPDMGTQVTLRLPIRKTQP